MARTQAEIDEAVEAIKRGELDPLDFLTKRGRQRLEKYIERLIDVAAQGNADFAEHHARHLVVLVMGGQRQR